MKLTSIVALTLACGLGAVASAQQPAPAQDLKPLEMTVKEIKGDVDVKRPADAAWGKAAKDMKLPENSEVATGLNSSVKLVSTENIEIVVKHASYLKVTQSAVSAAATSTKLDLQYGAIQVDVKSTTGRANLMSIRAPNATTSITGTTVLCVALGRPSGDRQRPAHALVMFTNGSGKVFKTVGEDVPAGATPIEPVLVIVVGEREAIATLGTLPLDNLIQLASTAVMPFTGLFLYESMPVDGLIVEDTLYLGDIFAGSVQGSSTSPNQVVVNASAGSILPGPPPPPPIP